MFVGEIVNAMIVYKYKSLGSPTCAIDDNKQLERFKEICTMGRLYAALFRELDDPMEGIFDAHANNEMVQAIINKKDETRICALSPTYQSMLMWSFYANEHKGCCIGVEIDDDQLQKVNYVDNPLSIENPQIHNNVEDRTKTILLRKYKDWAFEEELRVLTHNKYVNAKVKIVYMGMRSSDELVEKLKADLKTCNKDIEIVKMKEDMFVHINTSSKQKSII